MSDPIRLSPNQPAAPPRSVTSSGPAAPVGPARPLQFSPQSPAAQAYGMQAHQDAGALRAAGAPLPGAVTYESLRASLMRGDFGAIENLPIDQLSGILTRLLSELSELKDPSKEQLLAAEKAFARIYQADTVNHGEGGYFVYEERQAARLANDGIEKGEPRDKTMRQALGQYHRWVHRNDPESLLADVKDPENNVMRVYHRLKDSIENTGRVNLNEAQRKQVVDLLRERMQASNFDGSDLHLVGAVFEQLNPEMTDNQWADLCSDMLRSQLEHGPKDEFLDYLGMIELGKTLKKSSGESRTRLLAEIRKLYPKIEHGNTRRALVEEAGGRDLHGHFIPADLEKAGPSKDPYYAQIDRMAHPQASGDDYKQALAELRRQNVPAHKLAQFYTDGYSKTKDADAFIKPLLDQPDPEGEAASAIAYSVINAESRELYGYKEGARVEAKESVRLLGYLAQHKESTVARAAATRVLSTLADISDEKVLVASPELLDAVEKLPPGAAVHDCCRRLLKDPRLSSADRRRLEAVMERSLKQAPAVPADLSQKSSADEELKELGYQLSDAVRTRDSRTSTALRKVFNDILQKEANLPPGDYVPSWMAAQTSLWTPWSEVDRSSDAFTPANPFGKVEERGSPIRDFVVVARQLPESRRKELVALLGDLPQTAWKDNPLGMARGTRGLRDLWMNAVNDHGREVDRQRWGLREPYLRDADRDRYEKGFREARNGRYAAETREQGLVGRFEAARDLGDSFDLLTAYAKKHKLKPEQFDRLLMRAGGLAAENHAEAVKSLLTLADKGDGIKPEDLRVLLENYKEFPDNVRRNLAAAGTAKEALNIAADRFGFELRERVKNPEADLFQEHLRVDRGEDIGSFLIRQGRGASLMVDPSGGESLIDTLLSESRHRPVARMGGRFLLEQLEKSPGALGRMAKVQRLQFEMRSRYISPEKAIADLAALRRPLDGLEPEERRLQQLVNIEVSVTQAKIQQGRRGYNEATLRSTLAAGRSLQDQVEAEIKGLPDDLSQRPDLRRASGQLEASKQILEAQRILLNQSLSDAEKDRRLRESLELKEGMDHRAIRGLIRLAVDSPTDSVYLGVKARAGVEVGIPFFGTVRAFVEGKAGFEIRMAESGRVSVSFNTRIGVGAEAESQVADAEASAGKGKYHKVTMVFANEDEAAKFIQSILHQLKVADAPPPFQDPMAVATDGDYTEVSAKLGSVSVDYERREETSRMRSPVPWLPPDQTQSAEVSAISESASASLKLKGIDWGLEVSATDQKGSRNQTANGTTLTVAFQAGFTAKGGGLDGGGVQRLTDSPTQAFIDNLYESAKQMRPALLKGLNEEQAKARILQAFTHANLEAKFTAKGRLEVTMATPKNLMQDKGMNAMEVLLDFVANGLKDEKDQTPWHFYNLRRAREISLDASARFAYGAGVKVFAELGIEFKARDATTMVGSLFHAREVLYDYMRGAAFSATQLDELSKDGLLHRFGRERGTLNKDAFVVTLGMMRNELLDLWDDTGWRAKHAPGVSKAQFEANIDSYIEGIVRSMHAGLRNHGRTSESWEQFRGSVSLDDVRRADKFIESNNFQNENNTVILRRWQDSKQGVR